MNEAANKIKATKETRVSCRVPKKLYNRISKVSRQLGVDASDVVRMALNRALPEYEKAA